MKYWLPCRTICRWRPETIRSLMTISLLASRPMLMTGLSRGKLCRKPCRLLLTSILGMPVVCPGAAIIPPCKGAVKENDGCGGENTLGAGICPLTGIPCGGEIGDAGVGIGCEGRIGKGSCGTVGL